VVVSDRLDLLLVGKCDNFRQWEMTVSVAVSGPRAVSIALLCVLAGYCTRTQNVSLVFVFI